MRSALEALRRSRVVPVITIRDLGDVDHIANGLVSGGISAVEVTLRTAQGLPAIDRLARRGDLTVGAGTVLSTADVDAAADAGAAFAVSPGIEAAVIDAARSRGLVSLPGIATPTELQHARALGLRQVKVFPISSLGGARFIEALRGPFPDMEFMPSGGVTRLTAARYLRIAAVFAVGASWLVPDVPSAGMTAAVHRLSTEALLTVDGRDG